MCWYRKLVNLARRDRVGRDIDRELSLHLEERVDELIDSGMTDEQARRAARRRFGNYQQYKERTRDMDIHVYLEALTKDARYAIRGLWKNPAFTFAAIVTLALGIGATPLPYSPPKLGGVAAPLSKCAKPPIVGADGVS